RSSTIFFYISQKRRPDMNKNFRSAFLVLTFSVLLFALPAAAQDAKCDETDYDCKIAVATKTIEADPSDAETYYNRGMAYKHKEQWTLSIRDFDKYLSFPVTNKVYQADGYRERAWVRHKAGDDRGALADLTKTIEINT